MRTTIWTLVALLLSTPSFAADPDFARVDAVFGRSPARSGDVHRYGFPRGDLAVTVDGVKIEPALALGGWVAFTPAARPGQAVAMGDLVLTEAEIQPVMQRLRSGRIEVAALHNHLLRATPPSFYMHIAGQGDPEELAKTIRAALEATGTPLQVAHATAPKTEARSAQPLDLARIEEEIGSKAHASGGVYQFTVPLSVAVSHGGTVIQPAMGVANAINFQPTGQGRAAVAGDLIAQGGEVEPLIDALLSNGIEVAAIHNHMLSEEPRLFFVHFWAIDDAVKLAHGLRAALDTIGAERERAH